MPVLTWGKAEATGAQATEMVLERAETLHRLMTPWRHRIRDPGVVNQKCPTRSWAKKRDTYKEKPKGIKRKKIKLSKSNDLLAFFL